jgi:hypothetical protein
MQKLGKKGHHVIFINQALIWMLRRLVLIPFNERKYPFPLSPKKQKTEISWW